MSSESNVQTYKKIHSDLEAKIIYEDFDGECFRQTEDGMEFIVLVSMPDDSGVWYEDEDGEEKFSIISKIFLTEDKYNQMLEIKQQKGW